MLLSRFLLAVKVTVDDSVDDKVEGTGQCITSEGRALGRDGRGMFLFVFVFFFYHRSFGVPFV